MRVTPYARPTWWTCVPMRVRMTGLLLTTACRRRVRVCISFLLATAIGAGLYARLAFPPHPYDYATHGIAGAEPWFNGSDGVYSLTIDDCFQSFCLDPLLAPLEDRGFTTTVYPTLNGLFPFHCLPSPWLGEWGPAHAAFSLEEIHRGMDAVDEWLQQNNATVLEAAADIASVCEAMEGRRMVACPYRADVDCKEIADALVVAVKRLRGAIEQGHEVGSHGVLHAQMTNLAADSLALEIDGSAWWLTAILDAPALRTFSYPHTKTDTHVIAATIGRFFGARCGGNGVCTVPSDTQTAGFGIQARFMDSSAEDNNAYAARAARERSWMVATVHGVGTHGFLPVPEDAYAAHFEWVRGERDAGRLWVDSFGRVLQYARLRDTLMVSTVDELLFLPRYHGERDHGIKQATTWKDDAAHDRHGQHHDNHDNGHGDGRHNAHDGQRGGGSGSASILISRAIASPALGYLPADESSTWPLMSVFIVSEGPACVNSMRQLSASVLYIPERVSNTKGQPNVVSVQRIPLPPVPTLFGNFRSKPLAGERCKFMVTALPPEAGGSAVATINIEWS